MKTEEKIIHIETDNIKFEVHSDPKMYSVSERFIYDTIQKAIERFQGAYIANMVHKDKNE